MRSSRWFAVASAVVFFGSVAVFRVSVVSAHLFSADDSGKLSAVKMSAELRTFLSAKDLDDVLGARSEIKKLSPADEQVVRSVLREWRDAQAVSNLLNHASLIPEDVREKYLLQGLAEVKLPYYALAAVLGVGELDADKLTPAQRKQYTAALRNILRDTDDVRAARASVAISHFVGRPEAPLVAAFLDHRNETARHNIRVWMFRTFDSKSKDEYAEALRKSGLAEPVQRRCLAEFTEYLRNPEKADQKRKSSLLFPYLPNLDDY
jgi:hypothetical protein